MIPAGNAGSQEILKTIPSRMSADDATPELASECSALMADSSPSRVQISELRNQLALHARRLRELEKQLQLQANVIGSPAPPAGVGVAGVSHSNSPVTPLRRGSSRLSADRERSDGSPGHVARRESENSAHQHHAAGYPSEATEVGSVLSGQTSKRRPLSANSPPVKDHDPYKHMFASSRFKHERMFDQELLMAIYEKPYQRMRHQAALFSSGIMGLLSMPFGPIGMVGGALLGALIGTILGAIVDRRTIKARLEDSELEKKRLKSLLRWASERHTEEDEILSLIEMVTLEFKPIADIAPKSNNARKLLKLLDQWIGKKSVTRQIWVYMEKLLQRWRELPRDQLLKSFSVLQVLTTMYQCSNRALDDTELQFVRRMERLLAHDSVKSVMAHAQQNVTQGERSKMESMVYADAMSSTTPKRGSRSPPNQSDPEMGHALGRASGDDDDSDGEQGSGNGRGGRASTPGGTSHSPRTRSSGGGDHSSPLSPEGGGPRTSSRGRNMVLKKPFFRDWEDFMDFDDTIKHKMPITLCEFDLLLQKESEDTKGWDVCVERKDLRIAKIMCGPGMITIRAWATFPGVLVNTAFYLFYNLDERTKWDKTFCKMAVVDSNVQGSDVVYCLMKIPTVTSRDFLQYRRVRVLEDGSILIVLRSAEHPNMPEDKSYIRVENKISGYILRQEWEDGKPVLRMFLMTCSDVKGMIPKWIINFLAPKKPAEWMDALRKAAVDYQASHPGSGDEMKSLQRFKDNHTWDYEPEAASSDADNDNDMRLQFQDGEEDELDANMLSDSNSNVATPTPSTTLSNGRVRL